MVVERCGLKVMRNVYDSDVVSLALIVELRMSAWQPRIHIQTLRAAKGSIVGVHVHGAGPLLKEPSQVLSGPPAETLPPKRAASQCLR